MTLAPEAVNPDEDWAEFLAKRECVCSICYGAGEGVCGYRPHTLKRGCWCGRRGDFTNSRCHIAIQFKLVRKPVLPRRDGSMKTLLVDIETSPAIAMIYGTKNIYVSPSQILEPSRMVCFAAKWHGTKSVRFYAEWQEGRASMVRHAHLLLSQADAVVHYYGDRFDEPHLNREFREADLGPPAPFQSIDLYKTVKNRFFLPSYKLDYVAQWLGFEGKLYGGGMELRKKLRENDPKARADFKRYNIRDVDQLEKVYDALLPWIPGGTGIAVHDDPDNCPRCGSPERQARGYHTTRNGRYHQYQCKGCGGWYSDVKRMSGANVRAVA